MYSFVVVWDHPKADRSRISPFDLVPPFCTFVGECLGSDAAGNPVVKGNGFSCYASSVTNVKEKMESSIYSTKVCKSFLTLNTQVAYVCSSY